MGNGVHELNCLGNRVCVVHNQSFPDRTFYQSLRGFRILISDQGRGIGREAGEHPVGAGEPELVLPEVLDVQDVAGVYYGRDTTEEKRIHQQQGNILANDNELTP